MSEIHHFHQLKSDQKSDKSNECTINVGSRKSQLALLQTNIVIQNLRSFYDGNRSKFAEIFPQFEDRIEFNIISMSTTGDKILDKPLPEIGSKSLFTRELEVALLEGKVDFVVHSLKDLPTTLPEGCIIGAVMRRDDPNDSMVLKKSLRRTLNPLDVIFQGTRSDEEQAKYRVGTSSHRRIAMLKRFNPRLECVNIRGNLNTRLDKLDQDEGDYDAIVLAKAGLDRMGWEERASCVLTPDADSRLDSWCYAVGQGALAIECRSDDRRMLDLLAMINDQRTTFETIAERSLMKKLDGGCSVPIGVRSHWRDRVLTLKGVVLSLDGRSSVEWQDQVNLDGCETGNGEGEAISEADLLGFAVCGEEKSGTRAKMVMCSELGERLANKIVDLGGLGLIRNIK